MKTRQLIRIVILSAVLGVECLAWGRPPGVSLSGGDGSSLEKAIIVKAKTEESGVQAEHDYIRQHYPGSKLGTQTLQSANGRSYDVMEFTTTSGKKKTLYFDITAYFGK